MRGYAEVTRIAEKKSESEGQLGFVYLETYNRQIVLNLKTSSSSLFLKVKTFGISLILLIHLYKISTFPYAIYINVSKIIHVVIK